MKSKTAKKTKPKEHTEVRWRSRSKALSTPQQEREWKILREQQALNDGLSKDSYYVPLRLERETNQDWFEIHAENIIEAGERVHEGETKLAAADQDRLCDEVSGDEELFGTPDGCMTAIEAVIEELEARGMSKAAIFIAMHNELNSLAEDILDPELSDDPNKPLFNTTEEPQNKTVAVGA